MSGQDTYHWIISSADLHADRYGLDDSTIQVQGQADEEYLIILKNSQSSSEQTSITEELSKHPSVSSSLLYTEVPGGQGPGNNTTKPGVLVVVGLTPAPEDEQDLNDWYRDEHINLLSKVPGWIKSQRLKAISEAEGNQYLALHYYASENGLGTSPEFKAAVTTPWTAKLIDACKARGPRGYSRWEWQL